MDISPELIAKILSEFQRRVEAIQAVGGISTKEVVEGRKVPRGWTFDPFTDYYVPPNFFTSTRLQ